MINQDNSTLHLNEKRIVISVRTIPVTYTESLIKLYVL